MLKSPEILFYFEAELMQVKGTVSLRLANSFVEIWPVLSVIVLGERICGLQLMGYILHSSYFSMKCVLWVLILMHLGKCVEEK